MGATVPLTVRRRPTPSGADTLEVAGILLHSRYDPRKEALRIAAEAAAATHVIVLSPGLGYLGAALAGREVLLVERHAAIAQEDPGQARLVAPTAAALRDRVLDWDGLESGRLAVLSGIILPEDEPYYASLRSEALRAVEMRAEEVATIRGFSATWEANLAGNRRWINAANGEGLEENRGKKEEGRGESDRESEGVIEARWLETSRLGWKGRTVAVLAAGPSLRDDLPVLAEACEHTGRSPDDVAGREGRRSAGTRRAPVIVAVDSALPAVLAAGVLPDAVVTIDPQPVKASCLDDLGGIPLIASVLSPPVVLARARRLLLFGQGHPGEAAVGVPRRAVQGEMGGSVATAAVALAVAAGASTLLLIGQDLSVGTGQEPAPSTHVGGTHFERRLLGSLGRFSGGARDLLRRMAPSNLRRVPAVGGGTVVTTPILDSYRLWLRDLASRRSDIIFVQTSPRGAAIGIPARSLADALQLESSSVDRTDSV